MVSELSRLRIDSSVFEPCPGTLCDLGQDISTVPLSTQVYEWVLANVMVGVILGWTSIPSRGNGNTPSRFIPLKPG